LDYLISKSSILFYILGGFFITNTIIAEFVGVKIFSLEQTLGFEPLSLTIFGISDLGFNLTAGVLLWPIVFVMTDVINEYYGHDGVKKLSFFAAGLICYGFLMIFLAIHLSPNTWWNLESGLLKPPEIFSMDHAFQAIFGQGLAIIVGSLVAFLIGQFIDVIVFQKIKKLTGEKKVWLRATGSTLVSQLIDSFIVLLIAFYFYGDWSLTRVLAIGVVNYIYKFIMAIGLTPVIYLAHEIIDRYLGEELAEKMKLAASSK